MRDLRVAAAVFDVDRDSVRHRDLQIEPRFVVPTSRVFRHDDLPMRMYASREERLREFWMHATERSEECD